MQVSLLMPAPVIFPRMSHPDIVNLIISPLSKLPVITYKYITTAFVLKLYLKLLLLFTEVDEKYVDLGEGESLELNTLITLN